MILTALSAYLPLLVKNHTSNTVSIQEPILFLGLYTIAVGVGGLRPCLMSFGADQFDDGDPSERREKGPFFNWYVFTMYCGSTISSTGIVWVQDHYGWALGPTILSAVLAVGLAGLVATSRKYRFQPVRGSPLTGVCQVVVAAVRNFNAKLPSDSSLLYELPDDNPVTKGFERIEHTTDLELVQSTFDYIELCSCCSLYQILDNRPIAAALLETACLRAAKASPSAPKATSVLWQVPQYALEGVGQVLTTIGQFSFFYSQAPPGIKTVCTALGLLSIAAGEYLSSFLLTAVQWATATGGAPGWIPDDLNEGHLDRFFWMMAGLGCLNLMAFVSCARRYKSRKAYCQRRGSNFVNNR